jgi:acyl carrier protein
MKSKQFGINPTKESNQMKVDRERILNLIYDSVEILNEQFARTNWLEKSPDTILSGPGGALDSLGVINLIAIVEEKIEADFRLTVSLPDFPSAAANETPLRSIGSLADYLVLLLDGK